MRSQAEGGHQRRTEGGLGTDGPSAFLMGAIAEGLGRVTSEGPNSEEQRGDMYQRGWH